MADPKNDTALSAYLEAHANDAQSCLKFFVANQVSLRKI